MKTWSIAGVVQRVWDGLAVVERVTRPPRLGHDLDVELDGAEWLAEREAEEEVAEPAPIEPDWVDEFIAAQDRREYFRSLIREEIDSALDGDSPNQYEPGLDDSELVAVRGLLQERYGDQVSGTVETGHDMGLGWAAETFPQYSKTSTAVQCSGSVEHPAGGLTHSPRVPPAGPQLDWHGWAVPAIREVLSEHEGRDQGCRCSCGEALWEGQWEQHVADLIADRVACDPARAIAALHNHKPQK